MRAFLFLLVPSILLGQSPQPRGEVPNRPEGVRPVPPPVMMGQLPPMGHHPHMMRMRMHMRGRPSRLEMAQPLTDRQRQQLLELRKEFITKRQRILKNL
jgi:hypothetical protein